MGSGPGVPQSVLLNPRETHVLTVVGGKALRVTDVVGGISLCCGDQDATWRLLGLGNQCGKVSSSKAKIVEPLFAPLRARWQDDDHDVRPTPFERRLQAVSGIQHRPVV